jgi:hypothetical protein
VREKSTALAAAKPTAVASSKGEYVITKLDDLVNWARRVSPSFSLRLSRDLVVECYSSLPFA